MKKRKTLFLLPLFGLVLSGCTFQEGLEMTKKFMKGNIIDPVVRFFTEDDEEKKVEPTPEPTPEPEPIDPDKDLIKLTFDKDSEFTTKEGGLVNEIVSEEKTFEFVGLSSEESKLGKLAQFEVNSKSYNGHIYNRTMFDGLRKISATYTGAPLYYVFSNYLMDDISFRTSEDNLMISGESYAAPEGYRYFMVFTDSSEGAVIESLTVKYVEAEVDFSDFVYGDSETYKYNRSVPKSVKQDSSSFELETKPQTDNNNYAHGTDAAHPNDYAWYRWNGLDLSSSEIVNSNDVDVQMTIVGDFDYMSDESKLFNYHVWIDFEYYYPGDEEDEAGYYDGGWVYMVIGNDNYEPMGHEDPNRVNTAYDDNYAGRFFTRYDYDDRYVVPGDPYSGYRFEDPDYAKTKDNRTYREVYESMPYPYWNVKFHVEGDECITYLNGVELNPVKVFDDGYHTTEPVRIKRIMIGGVNYGDTEGNPLDSYKGTFTKPRFKQA